MAMWCRSRDYAGLECSVGRTFCARMTGSTVAMGVGRSCELAFLAQLCPLPDPPC